MTRDDLIQLMGTLPIVDDPVDSILISKEEKENYILERLVLKLNGYEDVPAIFTYPKSQDFLAPYPTVLFNHSHGNFFDIGKTELLSGCPYMLSRGYAYDLAKNGIAALCIDHMCFEERMGRTESATYKKLIWNGCYMWPWMVFDSLRAIDYLVTRPDVDSNNLATLGMSMGSWMTQWVSALDTRIKACIDICCLTNFDELAKEERFDQHGIYYYIPGMQKKMTTSQLNGLIAPRAHLSIIGNYDPHTPKAGVDRDEVEIGKIYADMGAEDNWKLLRYPVGHVETEPMRYDAMNFLLKHLNIANKKEN